MPYAALLFDDAVDIVMRGAATRISKGSPFAPHPIFHVPILGSLHPYSAEEVASACSRVFGAAPIGRFIKWQISGAHLRAVVELDDVSAKAVAALKHELPLGRPWAQLYVDIGSVAAIEAAQRADFLKAVNDAFPICQEQPVVFKARVEYNENNVTAKQRAQEGSDRSTSAHPGWRSAPAAEKKKSPHRRWERKVAVVEKKPECGGTTAAMDTTGITSAAVAKLHRKAKGTAARGIAKPTKAQLY